MRGPDRFELSENCRKCQFRRDGFFCQLDGAALKDFDALTSLAAYPADALLFMENEPSRGVFVLCHGEIKLSMCSRDGKTLILRIAKPGEALGLAAAISGAPYEVTAETLRPSQVAFVRRADFLKFIRHRPDVYPKIARHVSSSYEGACDRLRVMGLASIHQKLARILLDWTEKLGEDKKSGLRITVALTHGEIGELIGSTRESVTRVLSDFKRSRLITVNGTAVTIHDRKRMEEMAVS